MKKAFLTILIPFILLVVLNLILDDPNFNYFCVIMFCILISYIQQYFWNLDINRKIDILKQENKIYQSTLDTLKFIDEKQFNQLVLLIKQKLNEKK